MSARAIVLLRHGETDYNRAQRMQGQIDIPLNDHGREQARRAAEALAAVRPTTIISSDLSRAKETADVVADQPGIEVATDPRLRERSFGTWEGKNHLEIEQGWPEQYVRWRAGQDPAEIGLESRADAAARVGSAVLELGETAGDDEVLVLVAHGAAITLSLTHVLGLPPEWHGFGGMGNCHWSVLAPNAGRTPDWRLVAHNVGVQASARPPSSMLDRAIAAQHGGRDAAEGGGQDADEGAGSDTAPSVDQDGSQGRARGGGRDHDAQGVR